VVFTCFSASHPVDCFIVVLPVRFCALMEKQAYRSLKCLAQRKYGETLKATIWRLEDYTSNY
jgi:hypothetical protein